MIHMLLDFINFMRDNLEQSNDNDSAILKWLELVIELSDDSEVNLNHELSDTMEALKYVKNNFRPKVFQYSLRFPTLSNEIINGALCFNAGYPKDMVEQFAEKGLIKCGYMPKHEDETGSFIVVKISEPENGMVVFDNVSEKTVLHSIRRASTEAIDSIIVLIIRQGDKLLNRLELKKYIAETYGIEPDCPWSKNPNFEVYRHSNNKKWFALIMDIPRNRIGLRGTDIIDVVNLKCDPLLLGSVRTESGIFPAYHMNKENWVTAALDGSASEEIIKMLLDVVCHCLVLLFDR